LKNTKIREEGSSATDFVTDVTDVTPGSQKEEGRRKKKKLFSRPKAPCPMPHAPCFGYAQHRCPMPHPLSPSLPLSPSPS